MDLETMECPVSLITPDSLSLLHRFYEARRTQKATGGVLYGADSSRWPARWYHAVNVIQAELEKEEAAANKAARSQ